MAQDNKGFGKSNAGKKKGKTSGDKLASRLRSPTVEEPISEDWIRLCSFEEVQASPKPTKPVILRTGAAVVVYYVGGRLYCSDAYSTAFKYPLADANIVERPGGPAVEVPLDGTVYELATGKVLAWCPTNNPVRSVLGGLKSRTDPIPLVMYPVQESGGDVYVKLVGTGLPTARV